MLETSYMRAAPYFTISGSLNFVNSSTGANTSISIQSVFNNNGTLRLLFAPVTALANLAGFVVADVARTLSLDARL